MNVSIFRKTFFNLLSPNVMSVVGKECYRKMLWCTVSSLPQIIKYGDLRPLDSAMGKVAKVFNYSGRKILFDCHYADAIIHDGSFTFGLVREILIRNCYLRYMPADSLSNLHVVVDLGANRGLFSIMAASFAKKVISVEALPDFAAVIAHNAHLNEFHNLAIESKFIGAGGLLAESNLPAVDFKDLLDQHGVDTVDLLKIDIEGSEFSLFRSPEWLSRVKRICMEVHSDYGKPSEIVACLNAYGFNMAFADSDLRRVTSDQHFDFIYAWR